MSQRIVWQFGRLGRARLGLWKACERPDDAPVWQSLERTLQKLRDRRKPGESKTDGVICDLLIHLAWHSLHVGDLDASCRRLGELDAYHVDGADLSPRVSLRWSNMERLLVVNELRAYVEQARRFVADPLVGRAEAAEVLKATRIVYEQVSPIDCAAVLSSANGLLGRSPVLKACLAVCQCPERFASAGEAASWASRVPLEHTAFSSRLKIDARLIHARAAEWAGNFDLMEKRASEAVGAAPGHLSACYWLARARLYHSGRDPSEALNAARPPESVEWTRLRRQIDLYLRPHWDEAEAILPDLAATDATADTTERVLITRLLQPALSVDPWWDDVEMDRAAGIAARVEAIVGRQAWAQPAIALWEIRHGRPYAAAIARLEAEDVRGVSPSRTLCRLARVLAGCPVGDAEDRDECLEVIETAMARALGAIPERHRHAARTDNDRQLWAALADTLRSPWCERFPALRAAVDVLRFAMAALLPGEAWPSPEIEGESRRRASPWMIWLYARAVLARWLPAQAACVPPGLDLANPLVARSVADRWMLYGHVSGDVPPAIEQCRQRVESRAAAGKGRPETPFPPGSLAGRLVERESHLREACRANGEPVDASGRGEAAGRWATLLGDLAGMGLMTAAWWAPAVRYRYGVALACSGSPEAREVLEGLVEGPKGLEARAQLALLAVQRGDLETAERLLGDAPPVFPAIVYGQALLAHRRGDHAPACRQLESLAAGFSAVPSPYHLAARRLSAAIAERQGQPEKAEQLHRATLAECPADDVSLARLRRLVLKRGYAEARAGRPMESGSADGVFPDSPATIPWSRRHAMLQRALLCTKEQVDGVRSAVVAAWGGSERADAWFQVIARRLLQAGRPREAGTLLDSTDLAAAPAWNRRSRLILRAWQLLGSVWSPPVNRSREENGAIERQDTASAPGGILEQIRDCAQKIEQLSTAGNDEDLRRWHFLIERARALGYDERREIAGEAWGALAGWPIAALPHLWSGSKDERVQAAESLAAAVGSAEVGWNDHQRRLLTALSSWAGGRHDAFLDVYSELESVLDELPVRGPGLWVAAASLWFRRGDWNRILEGNLPNCVADLADSQVRLLTGFAYARAATADCLNEDFRSAVRRIEQAQSTLDELLQPAGLQGSLALSEPQKAGKT